MTDRELMQQALDALIWTTGSDDFGDGGKAREGALKLLFPSIAALRERLAQPEMQPCAGRNCGSTNPNLHSAECFEDYEKATGMAQPEQEPVAWGIIASNTGHICQVELDADEVEGHNPKHIVPLYTSPPAPTQEPYGYFRYDIQLDAWVQNKEANVGVAFYTEPPKREWVALTEDEIFKLYMGSGCTDIEDCEGFEKVAKVVEAKLKEKNT